MTPVETKAPNPQPRAETTKPWALDDLPPFPLVATRLLEVLSQDNAHITGVGRIIAAEPVFASRVLQMANSPLFALQTQVKTISHAIVLLGLDRVKAITVTRALGDFVGPVLNLKALRACWQNSLACALLSEKLARACKIDTDFAYVAGLLRDIGRLALLVKYPDSYVNLLAVSGEQGFDLIETERELFDIDHCQAGAWLMARMPFPPELCEVVAKHHEAPSGPFRMVHLVRIAGMLADALGFSVLPAASQPTFGEVIQELPEAAAYRFTPDPDELRADISGRIQSWG
ncbi:MAG TPA: HDOD domain-containing protein [Bryobacteraceae bacterium]|nr:HDOD domain-containing protein [Bryobacteraceae bacterium]